MTDIDIFNNNKDKINVINDNFKKIKLNKLFNIINLHMYFKSHYQLLNQSSVKRFMYNVILTNENDDNNYEHFIDTINIKTLLLKEINMYYDQIIKMIS